MSYFSKYKFISPEPIYAIVKEELKSYFDSGAVDDMMFPTYTNKCLEKLGRGMHPLLPVMLVVEDFIARLPDNFYSIREAWYCTWANGTPYTSGKALYTQTADLNTIQISPLLTNEVPTCNNPICDNPDCGGECLSSIVQAVYKTVEELPRTSFKRQFLLKPGNISLDPKCQYDYNETNALYGNLGNAHESVPYSASFDSFDIHDNKFVTTFREGIIDTLMYVSDYDDLGGLMVPDNLRIREYIEAFLKYKVFETLVNQSTDESFNILVQKMQMYKVMSDEAYIMAEIEIKKQDAHTKKRRIKKLKNRFDKYELPSGSVRRYRNGRYY